MGAKTPLELSHIEEACRITDEIFSAIIRDFHFKRERDLAQFIRRQIRERGLREAFPPIVSGGARAGNEIHPKVTDAVLEGFVIIDFGVRVAGYCSDMTRTVFVGKPSAKDKALYALVLGVGKRIHEKPIIFHKRTEPVFQENEAVTIEPGIYIPKKLGIRIEETYFVGKKGLRALTHSPQKLITFSKR
jgi:Xaa-Pro aminopeptidase